MKLFRMTYTRIIALGFFALIILGALLLSLPIASTSGEATPFLDSLVTSTSATCVTGLVIYDTLTHWTLFGQIVIILLIQIGGLGFMTVITMFSMIVRRQIGLKERILLMQSAGNIELGGTVKLIRRVLLGTLIFEGIGAALLAIRFIPQFGIASGIYKAVFTSISAFCNAGFDLLGDFKSLTGYYSDPLVLITISLLILIGGIGFLVWSDIAKNKFRFSKYSLHSKLVLTASAVLVVGGTLLFLIFENNATLAEMSPGEKLLNALFLSVTPRTAGFANVDYAALSEAGHFLSMLLMVVGGSAGSTAGGIKITTLLVLLLNAVASSRNSSQIVVFKRGLDEKTVKQAATVVTIYFTLVTCGSVIICAAQHLPLTDVLFEAISAASTVGLTTGITGLLGVAGKIVITVLMFGGRIGGLTLALTFAGKRTPVPLNRPVEKILIG